MDHYETLGVARDASQDEIRKAYRRKSMAAHPDRDDGGNEKMQAVNRAYEVLGDPERRARYDETGDDTPVETIEDEARSLLRELFIRVLDTDEDIVLAARGGLDQIKFNAIQAKGQATQRKAVLERRRGLVKTRDGSPNIVHQLLDEQINACDRKIAHAEGALRAQAAALIAIDVYEFTGEPPMTAEQDMARRAIADLEALLGTSVRMGDGGWRPFGRGRRY